MTVNLTFEIPDALATVLPASGLDRKLLEALAVQGYRDGTLSLMQVRLLLGFESRWEAEDFLSAHNAWPDPRLDEMAEDAESLRSALGQ